MSEYYDNVMVSVIWRESPEALSVAVADSTVSHAIVPELDALKTAILAMVTGSESDPFAVKVLVRVYVAVPPVCAYVATARIKPPPPVAISAVSVVSVALAAVAFAVSAMYVAAAAREPDESPRAEAAKSRPALVNI
jgi:uncharacterized membrane protein (DUF485 family)